MLRSFRHENRIKWSVIAGGIVCGVFLLLGNNVMCLLAAERLTIRTNQGCRCSPLAISVEVTVGEHWLHVSKRFFLKIRAAPQLVIWSEDQHGRFLETLFITRKMGQQRWGQDADPTHVLYWEALPYWMYKRHERGYAGSDAGASDDGCCHQRHAQDGFSNFHMPSCETDSYKRVVGSQYVP